MRRAGWRRPFLSWSYVRTVIRPGKSSGGVEWRGASSSWRGRAPDLGRIFC
jgi:hypothetical protein